MGFCLRAEPQLFYWENRKSAAPTVRKALKETTIASSDKLPQVGAELLSKPWGHIKLLIDKCKNEPKKVLFYSRKTIEK